MFENAKSNLRKKLWSILGPPETVTPVAGGPVDPVGIDRTVNLPLHYEPPECSICVFGEWECHDCGGTIINPDWPFGVGMESITFTHMHIHAQQGKDGAGRTLRTPARRKLCLPCFRIDWAKGNPGIPCDL